MANQKKLTVKRWMLGAADEIELLHRRRENPPAATTIAWIIARRRWACKNRAKSS